MSGNGQSQQYQNAFGQAAQAQQGQGQQGTISAVDRAREVARQVAERQKEIGATDERRPGFYTADGKTFLGPLPAKDDPFTPDQHELRQLLVIKLRSLAADLELGQFEKKYPNAGQVRQRVARLGDIAGALE